MSHYLEAAATLDPIRAKHLAQTDAVRFTEEHLVNADLDYLTSRARRDADRVRQSAEQEVIHFRAAGWM